MPTPPLAHNAFDARLMFTLPLRLISLAAFACCVAFINNCSIFAAAASLRHIVLSAPRHRRYAEAYAAMPFSQRLRLRARSHCRYILPRRLLEF